MRHDSLKLFNTTLVELIVSMNDDELWNFYLSNQERIGYLTDFHAKDNRPHPATSVLYAYPHGIDYFRKHFLSDIEDYREDVIFTTVIDFCFLDESVPLGYWAQSGFLDSANSCDVKTSDEIMPPVDKESEAAYYGKYFHLLGPEHLENIARKLEENIERVEDNTREDLKKIKKMKRFCLKNKGYNAAYIYDWV